MAKCAFCSSTILFGGKRQGEARFCNAQCEQRGVLASVASQLPSHQVDPFVRMVHLGNCPKCKGAGPVDVHVSYRVWSALVMTSWSSRPTVCCKRCGVKKRLGDTAFSLLLGWWGIPWGILITPLQMGRNAFGLFRMPEPSSPSPALERMLRLQMAAEQVEGRLRTEPVL